MKFIYLCIFSSLLLFSFSSCKSTKKAQNEKEIPFETVLKTLNLGSEKEANKVIQAQSDFKSFEVANNNDMPKELLEVDLDKKTLLMVMSGMKNTGGFDVSIEKITEDKNQIHVFYKESTPPKDAMLTMALTYPLHAVSIDKTDKKIVFEKIE